WGPSARPERLSGEVQLENAPESRLHWKVEPASVEVNWKLAVVSLVVTDGLTVIAVSGAVTSTVHVNEAGVASVLPTASVARTWKVCEPSATPKSVSGEVQLANAPESSLHWKVKPVSVALNWNTAVVALVGLPGETVIDVSGGRLSTVQP